MPDLLEQKLKREYAGKDPSIPYRIMNNLKSKGSIKRMALGDVVDPGEPDPEELAREEALKLQGIPQATPVQAEQIIPPRMASIPATAPQVPPEQRGQDSGSVDSEVVSSPVVTTGQNSDVVPPRPTASTGYDINALESGETGPAGGDMAAMPPRRLPRTEKMLSEADRLATQKSPPMGRQALGTALAISPHFRGVGALISGDTQRQRELERLKVREYGANEEQQLAQQDAVNSIARQNADRLAEVSASQVALNNAKTKTAGVKGTPKPTYTPKELYGQAMEVPNMKPETAQTYSLGGKPGSTAGGAPRMLSSTVVTRDSYNSRRADGEEFQDVNGTPITGDLAPNEVLQMIGLAGNKIAYARRNQNDKVVTVGGKTYAVAPQEVQQLPTGAGTDLGVSRTPSVGTHQAPAVDTAGNPTFNTLTSTRTPATPGIPGRPATGVQGTTPTSITRPTLPISGVPTAPPSTAPVGNTALPPRASGAMFPHNAREQQMRVVRPIREATTQIFGDPAQPAMKSLKDFAGMANDASSRQRTGEFLRMTLDAMKAQEAGHGGVGASLGPVNVSAGGFGQWLQELAGIPGAVAGQQVARMGRSLDALNPREKAYVDAFLAARSAAVGLRSATGGSSHQFAVQALEQDLPLIGINSNNSQQYLDKLQHLAGIAANGMKGYNQQLIDQDSPGTYDRIRNLPGEIEGMKSLTWTPDGKGWKKVGNKMQLVIQ